MKVRMLQTQAGDRFVRSVGDVVEVDSEEGKRLIEARLAEPVRQQRKETAVSHASGSSKHSTDN